MSIRPETYYDDGPFDAPSSESDDEAEGLLEKPSTPGHAELALPLSPTNQSFPPQPQLGQRFRFLLLTLLSLIFLCIVIGIFAAHSYVGTAPYKLAGTKKYGMEEVFNGTFAATRTSVRWVGEAGDGVFVLHESNTIVLVDLLKNTTRILVNTPDVRDPKTGNIIFIHSFTLSAGSKYLLIKSDHTKLWRHSSFGNYWIFDVEKKTTRPLVEPSWPPKVALAQWAPTGEAIAYVVENDLYVLPNLSCVKGFSCSTCCDLTM
jgi:dipeptidyl aminopeptidase